MKNRKVIVLLGLVAILVVFGACKKSRYCHCVTKEGEPDTVVVNVDRSMRCHHIIELGFERLQDGEPVVTTQKVYCIELDDDTVATIPPRP